MARAGLSEAWAISYIQYIGVVSAGLPSPTRGGAPPNSPIGIIAQSSFATQHSAESVIMRQCKDRYLHPAWQQKAPGIHGKVTYSPPPSSVPWRRALRKRARNAANEATSSTPFM